MKTAIDIKQIEQGKNKFEVTFINDYPAQEEDKINYYPLELHNDKIMINNGIELSAAKLTKKKVELTAEQQFALMQDGVYKKIIPDFGEPFMVPNLIALGINDED